MDYKLWKFEVDSIKPTSKPSKIKKRNPPNIDGSDLVTTGDISSGLTEENSPKLSVGIDKNLILSEYQAACSKKGIISEVSTVLKGETLSPLQYPSHYRLISECRMKPSRNLQYRVKDLQFDNIVIFLLKDQASYLSVDDVENIRKISNLHRVMVDDVLWLRGIDFSDVKLPRYDYADQTKISQERVDLSTACAIHYGLNTGMVVRYLKGEYVGESRNSKRILDEVSPYIDEVDCEHIKRIIDHGCPSYLDFEEEYENKHMVLRKGNQQTFLQFPEVTAKAMNKEEKNSHVLALREWVVYFSPY